MDINTDAIIEFLKHGKLGFVHTWHIILAAVVLLGLEILARGLLAAFEGSQKIPIRGKHLDKLEKLDLFYIRFNKFATIIFVYHLILVTTSLNSIKWNYNEAVVSNTLLSLIMMYVFYDFFYMLFHRFLHLRSVYGFIHKHHHRQKAPSRGNVDAINVHPFEFVVGEYLHLFTIYMIPCHIYSVAAFIILGGIMSSLNHTRFDINIGKIFSVKVHDVHHRMPESNYSQYTMLWDRIFQTYRPYSENDKGED